ncbi:MAG: type 1 glutamine amidotransferase domain-containing protein [Proteobacteria bacterium]|nr:type 1 glutamine amidotransferase domain-containing protein [Pseudomonadota bacterium]
MRRYLSLCALALTLFSGFAHAEVVNKPHGKILIVSTSHAVIDKNKQKTGVWLEELAAPYYAFKEAGYDVVIASVKGGMPPIDPKSLEDAKKKEHVSYRFLNDKDAHAALEHSLKVSEVNVADYEALYLPGGHGAMYDFVNDKHFIKTAQSFVDANKVIGAVCHGPAALLSLKKPNGEPLVKARKVNGFTNTEEERVGLRDAVPFLLESKLKEQGGIITRSNVPFRSFATRDGNLITGQNPASSEMVAMMMIDALGNTSAQKAPAEESPKEERAKE